MQTEILYSCFLRSSGLNTDTRSLKSGQMFWALKGENFNGNRFVAQALEAGASFVVCDEDPGFEDKRLLKVKHGLHSLQDLARHHRQVWGKHVLAVCGSNGKTTTKELINAALSVEKSVFATPGNLNNHIGVPLSLLRIRQEHDVAVIEMGANHPGEIAELCAIALPDSGLITNIGKDHLEGFGSVENTAEANAELFDFLREYNGTAFINTADEWNRKLRLRLPRNFSFPAVGDDAPCQLLDSGFFLRIQTDYGSAESRLTGKYNFHNLATALAVASYFGIHGERALQAVCAYEPGNNRSQLIETGRNRVISDAYNANPSSMLAALENLASLLSEQKCAILGDMLELGKDSSIEHGEIGQWAASHPEIRFLLTGTEMKSFAENCPDARYFPLKSELEAFLSEDKITGHTVLLKASRGMQLETLIHFL